MQMMISLAMEMNNIFAKNSGGDFESLFLFFSKNPPLDAFQAKLNEKYQHVLHSKVVFHVKECYI